MTIPPPAPDEAHDLRIRVGDTLAAAERALILATMAWCDQHVASAAQMLGISARTVYNKRRRWRSIARKRGRRAA